jgi:GxxExxY protein
MNNRQRWAIIREARMDVTARATRDAARAEKKAEKEKEKADRKAAVEKDKAERKAAREMEREIKKALAPPKKRGRLPKVAPPATPLTEVQPVVVMPDYDKLETLRGMAEEVYKSLGGGHLESIYHAAMAVELRLAGLMYESEHVMPVTHKGNYVGTVRADIIVNKECVLEFKISGKIDDAKQQARQYMKLQGIAYGFVVMFPKTDGGKIQFVDARMADEMSNF